MPACPLRNQLIKRVSANAPPGPPSSDEKSRPFCRRRVFKDLGIKHRISNTGSEYNASTGRRVRGGGAQVAIAVWQRRSEESVSAITAQRDGKYTRLLVHACLENGCGSRPKQWGTSRLSWFFSGILSEDECNDSINNVGSQARVDFGGANQPKGSEERSRTC